MIEVEAKVRMPDSSDYRSKIKSLAKFIKKENKIDDYYTLQSLLSYPKKSLRVRKKGNIYEINFKQRISYKNGIHAKNEHEFTLKNISPFIALITDFGFKHWLRKEKTTELYNIEKNFNIEINNVKNLGWFLEVEYLCNKDQINNARKRVLEILKKLNVKKKDIVKEGYTKMLWDKRKLGI